MFSHDDGVSANLKIMRGYRKLLGIPLVAHGSRTVALERVGDCEISMFETLGAGSPDGPLFWMELFDLRVHASLDSRGCRNLYEAAEAFTCFASRATRLAKVSLCEADEIEC